MFADSNEAPPRWKDRARERSLAGARQRADDQVTRLVHTAQAMVNDDVDITVPSLVARAGMSTKTFYRHFASRDELLLAVLEEELSIGAHLVRKDVDNHHEPTERFRAFILAYTALPSRYRTVAVSRARIQEAQRLRAVQPQRFREANAPMQDVLREVIDDLIAAALIDGRDADLTTRSILHLLTGHIVDAAYEDTRDGHELLGEHTVRVCCRALGLPQDL